MSTDAGYQAQARELQLRNADLLAACQAKDDELASLREFVDAVSGQDLQGAKIIELSKKVRSLTVSLEKERQKVARLNAEAANPSTPKRALDPKAIEDVARTMVEQAAEAADAAQREATQWKERHQQQTNKVAQLEQKVFSLEIENKKLQRALVREVGDDIPLAKVLDEGSDWKGRRELVISLKDQVRSLKAAQGQAPEARRDVAAKETLTKISKEKAAEADRALAELVAARQEVEALRLKCDAVVARRKVVENELAGLKDKVAIVLDKSHNDDRLIAALRLEVASAKSGTTGGSGQQAAAKPPASGSVPLHLPPDEQLWVELSQLRRQCREQAAQIDRQQAIVLALQQQLEQLQAGQRGSSGASTAATSQRCSMLEQDLRLAEAENARLQGLLEAMVSSTPERQ